MIKKILFLAFCINNIILSAQQAISDTSYLEYTSGKFFNVQVVVYEDESSETFRRFLCDSSSVYRYFNSEVLSFSSATSNSVKQLNRVNKAVSSMRDKLLYIESVSNISLLDSFMRDNVDFLLSQSWEIVHADSVREIQFSKTQAGVGRYVVSDFPSRQFQILGKDIILLKNYADGLNKNRVLTLYRIRDNYFESDGKTYIMRRVNKTNQKKRATSNPQVSPKIDDVKSSKKIKSKKN